MTHRTTGKRLDGWQYYKVSDFAKVIGGGTPKTEVAEYWNGKIPWITPKDLSSRQARKISRGERSISQEGLQNSGARIVPPDTVLLTSRAPVGYLAIAQNELTTNQGFRNLVVKENFLPEFIYYLLLNNVDYLKQHASGSTFQELSGGTLKNLEFQIPAYDTQKEIAKILSDLDEKIELNHQMNKTLESITQAIFKRWFVEFEFPDEKGNPYKSSDGKMVESELGEIPRGWEIGTVGETFDLIMGQSPPGETYNEIAEGLPFFQGRADFGFRYPSLRVYCTEPTRFAEAGDTLISVRAPVGDINMAFQKCAIGRGVASARHKTGSRSFTYYFMRSIKSIFDSFEAEGTVFGSIGKDGFRSITLASPPFQLIRKFEETVHSMDQMIESNESESLALISIRDSLLPKLMSGEIRLIK